jgi:hypothetical protein
MNDKQLKKTPTASGNPVGGSISGFSEISDNEEEFLNVNSKEKVSIKRFFLLVFKETPGEG